MITRLASCVLARSNHWHQAGGAPCSHRTDRRARPESRGRRRTGCWVRCGGNTCPDRKDMCVLGGAAPYDCYREASALPLPLPGPPEGLSWCTVMTLGDRISRVLLQPVPDPLFSGELWGTGGGGALAQQRGLHGPFEPCIVMGARGGPGGLQCAQLALVCVQWPHTHTPTPGHTCRGGTHYTQTGTLHCGSKS